MILLPPPIGVTKPSLIPLQMIYDRSHYLNYLTFEHTFSLSLSTLRYLSHTKLMLNMFIIDLNKNNFSKQSLTALILLIL